jgi:hypothetical protein
VHYAFSPTLRMTRTSETTNAGRQPQVRRLTARLFTL